MLHSPFAVFMLVLLLPVVSSCGFLAITAHSLLWSNFSMFPFSLGPCFWPTMVCLTLVGVFHQSIGRSYPSLGTAPGHGLLPSLGTASVFLSSSSSLLLLFVIPSGYRYHGENTKGNWGCFNKQNDFQREHSAFWNGPTSEGRNTLGNMP